MTIEALVRALIVHEKRAVADGLAEFLRTQGDQTLPLYDAGDALDHLFQIQFNLAWISTSLSPITAEELAKVCRNSAIQRGCNVILVGSHGDLVKMKSRQPELGYLELSAEDETLMPELTGKATDAVREV